MNDIEYSFGYDERAETFILWRRGRSQPLAVIPIDDALRLVETVQHVETHRRVVPVGDRGQQT